MRVLRINLESDYRFYYLIPELHEDPDATLEVAGQLLYEHNVVVSIRVGGGINHEGVDVIQFSPLETPELEENWRRYVEALHEQGITVNGGLQP